MRLSTSPSMLRDAVSEPRTRLRNSNRCEESFPPIEVYDLICANQRLQATCTYHIPKACPILNDCASDVGDISSRMIIEDSPRCFFHTRRPIYADFAPTSQKKVQALEDWAWQASCGAPPPPCEIRGRKTTIFLL